MATGLQDRLERRITEFFIRSQDFNGIPAWRLVEEFRIDHSALKDALSESVRGGRIAAVFDLNPHIRRFADRPMEAQLKRIVEAEGADYCLYPTTGVLELEVDRTQYADSPYTLELALGAPQLEPRFFDLAVLEVYRNDPRYHYDTNDISGWLSVSDKYYRSEAMAERDKISLQDFGFAYDGDFNRVVAVYLRYLSDLSPEHQRIWHARRVQGEYNLHPDYVRMSILGEWPEQMSIFDAFIEELSTINKMTEQIGRPPLFKSVFEERPREFGFLVRPTSKELDDFVHLLDKMMSENISRDFFIGQVPLEEEIEREDGKVEVRQIGTIRLLETWFAKRFRTPDPKPLQEAFGAFRKVRKLRQAPAHVINDDEFDQSLFKEQRSLVLEAYTAVRTIRQCLANHPAAATVEVSEQLYKGMIWSM